MKGSMPQSLVVTFSPWMHLCIYCNDSEYDFLIKMNINILNDHGPNLKKITLNHYKMMISVPWEYKVEL